MPDTGFTSSFAIFPSERGSELTIRGLATHKASRDLLEPNVTTPQAGAVEVRKGHIIEGRDVDSRKSLWVVTGAIFGARRLLKKEACRALNPIVIRYE
jgi:hypothetical protein